MDLRFRVNGFDGPPRPPNVVMLKLYLGYTVRSTS